MSKLVVETKDLSKSFGEFDAVSDLNLQVKEGRICGFLGPNGAGKSTTIRMLLGLIKPTKGEIKIFGRPLKDNRIEILKHTGSLVEAPSYYGNLTAYENLKISANILGIEENSIDEFLEIVKLTKWKNTKAKKFSLGMKQRLGIALALIGKPDLLILDEPTNGLDPQGIHEIRELIKELPKISGVSIIISSHLLSEIQLMADDVCIINLGKLLFQGPLSELMNKFPGEDDLEKIFLKLIKGVA